MNVTIHFEAMNITVVGAQAVPRVGEEFVLVGAVGSTPEKVTAVRYQFNIVDMAAPPEITAFVASVAVQAKAVHAK